MVLRRIHKTPGMAPGIQAMEKGQPWTIPGNQFRRYSAGRAMQLESIHTLIQSKEKHGALLLSPTNALGEVTGTAHSPQPTECSEITKLGSCVRELVSDHPTTLSLIVPEVAKVSSGGCFDTSNWVFRMVWKHIHHMDTDELMENYFYREERGKYGEHHTSTRGVPNLGEFDEDAETKSRGSDNHRHQERGRRVRHRCLQRESDKCISKFNLDMAQQELPEIKEIIRQTHEEQKASTRAGSDAKGQRPDDKAQATNTSARKLGKDDQLAAVLMSQYTGFILIARLQEDLTATRDELDALNEKADLWAKELQNVKLERHHFQEEYRSPQESTEAAHWRQRFEKSEAEKQSLEDEVLNLRRQLHQNSRGCGSMTPFMQCSLPPPLMTTQERTINAKVQGPLVSPILVQSASEMQQRKRKRFTLEPPTVAIQINGQHRLPLSPAPSYDGSPSPSFHQV